MKEKWRGGEHFGGELRGQDRLRRRRAGGPSHQVRNDGMYWENKKQLVFLWLHTKAFQQLSKIQENPRVIKDKLIVRCG